MPDTASAAELYRWLHYVPATQQLTALDFVSTHSAPPFEEREFVQGSLSFSDIEGVFHPADSGELLALRREFLMELPPALAAQLANLP